MKRSNRERGVSAVPQTERKKNQGKYASTKEIISNFICHGKEITICNGRDEMRSES